MSRVPFVYQLLAGLVIACNLAAASPQTVSACSPIPDSRLAPICWHTGLADITNTGTILTVEESGAWFGLTATIEVDEAIKGEVDTEIRVAGCGSGPDCRAVVTPGMEWLFFIQDRGDNLEAHYTFPGDAIAAVTEENLDAARHGALLGPSVASVHPGHLERGPCSRRLLRRPLLSGACPVALPEGQAVTIDASLRQSAAR